MLFKITYDYKKDNLHLISKVEKFETLQKAIIFLNELRSKSNIVGRPVLERI